MYETHKDNDDCGCCRWPSGMPQGTPEPRLPLSRIQKVIILTLGPVWVIASFIIADRTVHAACDLGTWCLHGIMSYIN
jgi:hypothetical protein